MSKRSKESKCICRKIERCSFFPFLFSPNRNTTYGIPPYRTKADIYISKSQKVWSCVLTYVKVVKVKGQPSNDNYVAWSCLKLLVWGWRVSVGDREGMDQFNRGMC